MPNRNIDPRHQHTFKEDPETNPDVRPDQASEPLHEFDDEHPERNVPEEVIEEENDKPAGLAIHWSIIIAIGLLLLVYFIFIR